MYDERYIYLEKYSFVKKRGVKIVPTTYHTTKRLGQKATAEVTKSYNDKLKRRTGQKAMPFFILCSQ